MVRRANALIPCLLVAFPAAAQEARLQVDIPAGRLDDAIVQLGRQARISIGIRDNALAGVSVRRLKGRMTAAEAVKRLLAGSNARATKVAPGSYLIERAPARAKPVRHRPAAKPAQADASTSNDEIIVTGSKRDVPLRDYPGSAQIIDGADLSTAEAGQGTDAIETRTASLSSTHLGPGRNKLFIRGIADSSFVGPTQATVGQYWGNSRITYSAPDPDLRLYDIGRVEVLEGPQATLYGAGSLGGVLRVVPHAPELDHASSEVWAGVEAIEHGEVGGDAGAVLNVPLVSDKLALRTLIYTGVDGGYIDDTERNLPNVNRVRTVGGRAALRYEPGNDWTIDLNAVVQNIHGDDAQYADRDGDALTRASSIAQPFNNDFWLGEIVARKDWGDLQLTTAIAVAEQYVYERFEGVDQDDPASPVIPVNAAPAAYTQINRVGMITTETRLARNNGDGTGWLIGVSAIRNRARVNRGMDSGPYPTRLTGVRNLADEQTLFGEWSFSPLRRTIVTIGGRLTHTQLAGTAEDANQAHAFRMDPNAGASRSEVRFLPSAAITYEVSDRISAYARFQQGFRPGGLAIRRDFIQHFKGDRLSTVEAGLRYTGRALDLAMSGSWTRWTDIQADLVDGFGFPTTVNIGNGRILSFGTSAKWHPIAGFEADAALYLNNSRITRGVTVPVQTVDLTETVAPAGRVPNVADASARVGAAYTTAIGSNADLKLSGYVRYVGKSVLGVGSTLDQPQGNYADTGLEATVSRGRRSITLSVTNLLDTRGNRFALGTPFLIQDRNQITPLQPRSVRLGFNLAF